MEVRKSLKRVNTVSLALQVKTPSLNSIKRQYGEPFIEAYVKLWLINLNEVINATRPLKDFQIDETAELIVETFGNLTIADINVIFKSAKLGKYGDLYGTISINKILKWFSEYFDERCEVAGSNSRRQADKIKYSEERGAVRNSRETDEDFSRFKADYIVEKFKSGKNG